MKFQLVHKGNTAVNAVFHVLDEKDTVVGSVNVPPSQADDLQKHWRGAPAPGTTAAAAKSGVPRVRLPAMSKATILRGS